MRALVAALVLFSATSARADTLLIALSADRVTIESNFTGADLAVFGFVKSPAPGADYDVVITTKGPDATLQVRRKERVAGMWINAERAEYPNAPSFLSVLANKPREGAGLAAEAKSFKAAPLMKEALIRVQERKRLWREDFHGVTFFDTAVFRGTVPLPPNVPLGRFEVEAALYSHGERVATASTAFEVVKSGFEAKVEDVAERIRWGYGVATAALALLFGWGASAMFRRD